MQTIRNLQFPSLRAAAALLLFGASAPLHAGTGKVDVANKTIDLNVLFTYSETNDKLNGAATPTWQQVFNAGSKRLWNATNGQLRIGTVTCYIRALDKKDEADVWISPTGGAAYATDVGVSGVPGQHMQFFENRHRSLTGYLGDCSIAHEIGHYAFGLYDEYIGGSVPIAKKNNFTDADVRVEGNSPYIYSISPTDTISSLMDAGGGVAGANQRTEFDIASNIVKGVTNGGRFYMNKQWLKRKESCWETMSKLQIGGVNLFTTIPTVVDNSFPAGFQDIVFNVVPSISRLMLCIDRSGSMQDDNKMELAKAGASIFVNLAQEDHTYMLKNNSGQVLAVQSVTVDGDSIGVVDFDDQTTLDYPLTKVDANGVTKGAALSAIGGLFPSGSTAIGDGLQLSLDQITAQGAKVTQEAIVLLSDGMDNASTTAPLTAAANCAARGAKVYTIALGSDADIGTLGSIAVTAGGTFYQATDALGLLLIYPAINAQLKGGGLSSAVSNFATQNTSATSTTNVDPFSEETTFSLSTVDSGFTYSLRAPNGKVYSGSNAGDQVSFEKSGNEQHFRVSNPKAGAWKFIVKSPKGTDPRRAYQFSLTNTVAAQSVNVSIDTPLSTYAYPALVPFHCTVTAIDPVGGAEVKGIITGPNGLRSFVTLYDDGLALHADDTANDGVYSCAFLPFSGSGAYSIDVTVVNKTGKQAIVNPEKDTTAFVPKSIPPFQRTISAAVNVTGAPTDKVDWMRVDALNLTRKTAAATTGNVTITAELNNPVGQLNPTHDTTYVYIGNSIIYLYPNYFTATRTPGVYKIYNKSNKISGTLTTNIGGTSRSRLVLTQTGLYTGGTSFTSPLSVQIYSGDFYQTASLDPIPTPATNTTRLSYLAKRNFNFTPTLFIDGIKSVLNHGAQNTDTLRIVSTFEGGGQNYDPATMDATVKLGNFTLTIPKTTLTKNATTMIVKGKVPIGATSAQVTIDLKRHTFLLTASKLELDGDLDRTMATGLTVGNFAQAGDLTTKQTIRGKIETLTY